MAVSGLIFIGAFTVGVLFWLVFVTDGTYLGKPMVKFLYQRFAKIWNLDERGGRLREAANATLLPILKREVSRFDRPQVLDIATGTGRVPILIASDPAFDGHITGIDFSRNMLARGRAILRSKGLEDKVELIEGDGAALGMADGTFDLVCCIEAPLVSEKKVLKQAHRVLSPGGVLIYSKRSQAWGKLLPGKSMSDKSLSRFLQAEGLVNVRFEPWQRSERIVISGKGISREHPSASTVRVASQAEGG